jgi:hypothetical protein
MALAVSDLSSLYVKFSDLERCDPKFARELFGRQYYVMRDKSVIIIPMEMMGLKTLYCNLYTFEDRSSRSEYDDPMQTKSNSRRGFARSIDIN